MAKINMKEFVIGTITTGDYIKTLRDEFAMSALNGMLEVDDVVSTDEYLAGLVKAAYQIADACMKEREKP